MKIIGRPLPNLLLIEPKVFVDDRGDFVKTFHVGMFAELGIAFQPVEEFFSTSHKGVLRGMHFQLPPQDHGKLVYCVRGSVLDVVLDLRKKSPDYGRCASAVLSATNHHQFFIPTGFAHGFLSLEDNSVMVYKTSTVHAPAHDSGVRWDTFGLDWGVAEPIVSPRDGTFVSFNDFKSPF
jgi:dTDP-4-dehydrorhamnose 3,5-epimerase